MMRDQIWITILDADRLTRYYGRLATTNKRTQFWLNVVVTLCSLAAATVLLVDAHKAIPATLFFVVATSTTWGIFAEYSKKATLAEHAAKEYSKIKSDTVELWYDQYADDAMERAFALARRLDDVAPTEIEENKNLNKNAPKKLIQRRGMNSSELRHFGHPPRPPNPSPPPPPPAPQPKPSR